MRKSYRFLASWLLTCLFSAIAYGQGVTITGNVKNESTKEDVPSVSILVKGTSQGVYTDPDGGLQEEFTPGQLSVTVGAG